MPGDTNTVLGIDPTYRLGLWQLRGEYVRSSGTSAGGGASSYGVSYQGNRFSTGLRYSAVAPDFRAADGFIPFTGFHGWNLFARYGTEFRRGPVRRFSLMGDLFQDRLCDGAPFRRTRSLALDLQTRSDWAFNLGWDGGRFQGERDNQFTVGFTQNVSDRRRRWGLMYSFGTLADAPIGFWRPFFSVRVLKRYDIGWSGSILHHKEDRQQQVLTISREIDPRRSMGVRVTTLDGQSGLFLSYRNAGATGMETYLLIGNPDPNRSGFERRIVTKFVWPM
jgi:hypothetical protein